MKKQSEKATAPISNQSAKNLTVVNQSEASVKPKIFTAVDMWNIQRRSVTMFQRRNCA